MREIEVGSFVPARLLPQLADTGELVTFAKTLPELFVSVLVPNLKGAERAIESGADLLLVPLSASDAHSRANVRKAPAEMVDELARIRAARDAAGSKTLIEGGVGTAFGCTLQGRVERRDVLQLLQALLDAGADRVSIADTVGYADPRAVRELFEAARELAGERLWCGHFHDTRGLALANVYAAMEAGIARFDTSLAGIGGLSARAGRERQRCHRRPGVHAGEHGHRHGRRSRSAVRVARGGGRMAARRMRFTARSIAPGCRKRWTAHTRREGRAMTQQPLPLQDVRVVEFTHMVMGPTCGMILADLGAEVIKVEPPGGDKTRKLPGLGIGFFRTFNRNKKSVVLDIDTPRGSCGGARA